jgi:hypothetical protein
VIGGCVLSGRDIAISRRFAKVTEERLRDPEALSIFGRDLEGVWRWADLLEKTPVVVLGEGRSGKTHEFREQAKQLNASNRIAFFVPIERLHDEDFVDALDGDDLGRFRHWKESPSATGYFFLDAVDELKLREGSLRKAVKKLRAAVDPHVSRVRLLISCRPADWQGQIDEVALSDFCYVPSASSALNTELNGEAAFLEIIQKGDAEQGSTRAGTDKPRTAGSRELTIVALIPLSQDEVRTFCQEHSPALADAFCRQLEAHDLWHLYRLPAEIIDALELMAEAGVLGNVEEQLQQGVRRKLAEIDPKKRNGLSVDKALDGAERVALALFLLKRRSIKVLSSEGPNALDIGSILTDWTANEQQELISKPLFDPSGIGSVRFHHRASQEYLAARRLERLRKDGMPLRDIQAMLFGEIGAHAVVKPGLAPVTAWLSLWDPDILRETLRREPHLLFRQGLPSAFSLELRAKILESYVDRFAGKEWCRTGVGHGDLKRVADPNLGPSVRELWPRGKTGHDSRELLLELIWLTPLPYCADLALSTVLDADIDSHHRTYGAWGVIACGSHDQKAVLAKAVLDRSLPDKVVRGCVYDLLPDHISADQFVSLVNGMEQDRSNIHGLNYTIYRAAKRNELPLSVMAEIRDGLAKAVWDCRRDDCTIYSAHSEKDHYHDGLIAFCAGTIPTAGAEFAAWARAMAITMCFGDRQQSIIAKDEVQQLKAVLHARSDLREAFFWACLELTDALKAEIDDWQRARCAAGGWRQELRFSREDQTWLLATVSSDARHDRRGVAFWAIHQWFDLRENLELQEAVRGRIADRRDLISELERLLAPQPREKQDWEIKHKKRQATDARKERKRIDDWLKWRKEVLADPDFLMSGKRRLDVLYGAHDMIQQSAREPGRWGHWDADVIRRSISPEFLERYREELSLFWRDTDVQLLSERPKENRNRYFNSWLLALAALKAEAEVEGWAKRLTHDEAVRAARISFIELNGFGGFLPTLESAHPEAITEVISGEVEAQFSQAAEFNEAPILHDIHFHSSVGTKQSVAKTIAACISNLLALPTAASINALEYAVDIVAEAGTDQCKKAVITALLHSISTGDRKQIPALVARLGAIDPKRACDETLRTTEKLGTEDERQHAIEIFAAVFGGRHSRRSIDLSKLSEADRVSTLHQLVLRAYQTIRREDDVIREGTYSPDLRDKAQEARSFLLSSLLDQKCPEVLVAIHDLSLRPEFAHMTDRLREMGYECASAISDLTTYTLTAFQEIDRKRAFQPADNASLLQAMLTRLDAFEHDLLQAEDSPVEALRRLDKETQLRPFLAGWFRRADRGTFTFTQEAVALDEKRTDIRFQPRFMDAYGTVELKRETWSVRDFEIALQDQLVGQYLRHENCRAGILLICQAGPKQWLHPQTNALMNLSDVVNHLGELAAGIMAGQPEIHLAVKGIDYSIAATTH